MSEYLKLEDLTPEERTIRTLRADLALMEASRAPSSTWQGICGHLWLKERDGERCPACAAIIERDEALALVTTLKVKLGESIRRGVALDYAIATIREAVSWLPAPAQDADQ